MTPKSYLTRAAILAAEDRPTEEVEVPEWGGHTVRIARWSVATQWRVSRAAADDTRGQLLALVVALSLVDERGERLFSDEDLPTLMEKNFRALERIATAAMRWNGATRRGGGWPGKRFRERPERRFAFRLACALGLTVDEL